MKGTPPRAGQRGGRGGLYTHKSKCCDHESLKVLQNHPKVLLWGIKIPPLDFYCSTLDLKEVKVDHVKGP
jgi:hypothetical protein